MPKLTDFAGATLQKLHDETLPAIWFYRKPVGDKFTACRISEPGADYYHKKVGEVFQVKVRGKDVCRGRLTAVIFKKLKDIESTESIYLPKAKQHPGWKDGDTPLDVLVFERVEDVKA